MKKNLCEIYEVSPQEEEQQERFFLQHKDQMILNVFARPRYPPGGRRHHQSRHKQGRVMDDFYTYETPLDFSGRRDTCMSKTSFATALAGLLVTAESLQDHRRGAKNPPMDRHTVERALEWLGIKIVNHHPSTTILSWNMWDFHVHVNTIFPELLEDHHYDYCLRDSTTCSSPGPHVLPCASRLLQIVMESLHNAEISKDMMQRAPASSSNTKKNRHQAAVELVPGVWVQGPLWTTAPVLTTTKKKDVCQLPLVSADDKNNKMDEDDAFYTFSFFKRGILEQHEIFYSISSDEEEGSKSSDESCSSVGAREEGEPTMMDMTTTPSFISCLSNTPHCGIM